MRIKRKYYCSYKQVLGDYFLIAKDADEVTIISKENNINTVDFFEETKWFTMLEIRPYKPFLTVGFIAAITKSIADRGLNVLVVSTYSKDYILLNYHSLNAMDS